MTPAEGLEAREQEVTRPATARMPALLKTPTGISGLDEVTGGGLPHGRPAMWP
jgi:hypothetical protein